MFLANRKAHDLLPKPPYASFRDVCRNLGFWGCTCSHEKPAVLGGGHDPEKHRAGFG